LDGEPYTHKDGTKFDCFARACWRPHESLGRISLRFGPKDFKHKSVDGHGDDWPIGYDDVAPYYDKVDQLIGVFGSKENLPNDPDSIFLPPPNRGCTNSLLKRPYRIKYSRHPLAIIDSYKTY